MVKLKWLFNFKHYWLLNYWRLGWYFVVVADVVTDFIEGLVETYPGLHYLDGFPQVSIPTFFIFFIFFYTQLYIFSVTPVNEIKWIQVKVVLRAGVSGLTYDKVAVISGIQHFISLNILFSYVVFVWSFLCIFSFNYCYRHQTCCCLIC